MHFDRQAAICVQPLPQGVFFCLPKEVPTMKTKDIRLVSMILALCICLTILPQLAPEANALTLGYTPSTAYKASKYYTFLAECEAYRQSGGGYRQCGAVPGRIL